MNKWLQIASKKLQRRGNSRTLSLLQSKQQELQDWVSAMKPDLASLSVEQAIAKSDAWHASIALQGDGKYYLPIDLECILHRFNNGYTIQEIVTENDLQVEGHLMNHCIASYWKIVEDGDCRIVSLRDERNNPHMTIELDSDFFEVKQLQGNSNNKPKEKYRKLFDEWYKFYLIKNKDKALSNPKACYYIAKSYTEIFPFEKLQEGVLKDAHYSYCFAKNVKGADIKKLQEAVLKSAHYSCLFAKYIKGANIKKLQECVLESAYDSYLFAIDVKRANIKKLQEAVLKDAGCSYFFARDIKGADIKKLQRGVLESAEYSYLFARDIKGASIDKLQEAVLKSARSSYLFARYVKGADIDKLQECVLESAYYSYRFAKDIKGADIEKLQEGILKDAHYSYLFAKDIKGVDIQKL